MTAYHNVPVWQCSRCGYVFTTGPWQSMLYVPANPHVCYGSLYRDAGGCMPVGVMVPINEPARRVDQQMAEEGRRQHRIIEQQQELLKSWPPVAINRWIWERGF